MAGRKSSTFDAESIMGGLRDWLSDHVPGVARGMSPYGAALVHGALHEAPARVEDTRSNWEDVPRCGEWPCKAAGVSYAIFEMVNYGRENGRPGAKVVGGLEFLARDLDSLVCRHAQQIQNWAHEEQEILDKALRIWPVEVLDITGLALFTQGPIALIENLRGVQGHAHEVRNAARDYLKVLHHCVGPPQQRGRPMDAILIAVTQHLRIVGEFTFPEIAQLVPDGGGGTAEVAANRAEKRMKHQDLRSIFTHTERTAKPAHTGGRVPRHRGKRK